jgi:hypothetical protein
MAEARDESTMGVGAWRGLCGRDSQVWFDLIRMGF